MPDALVSVLAKLLTSKRVVAAIAAVVLAICKKYIPGVDESTVTEIVGVIIALIVGDSLRPVDPDKAVIQAAIAGRKAGSR